MLYNARLSSVLHASVVLPDARRGDAKCLILSIQHQSAVLICPKLICPSSQVSHICVSFTGMNDLWSAEFVIVSCSDAFTHKL